MPPVVSTDPMPATRSWSGRLRALMGQPRGGGPQAADRLSAYRPASLPTGRLFCLLQAFDHRDDQRVDETSRWAAERDIPFAAVTPDGLGEVGRAAGSVLWVPFPNAETGEAVAAILGRLKSMPADLPIIFDITGSIG